MIKIVWISYNWNAKGRTNVIGALMGKTLLALQSFTRTINSEVFMAWVRDTLLPQIPPQSVLIMDNATFHKRKDIQLLIQEAGHKLLYLPPYSPDLNPIEHAWAKPKTIRRKIQCDIDQLLLEQSKLFG